MGVRREICAEITGNDIQLRFIYNGGGLNVRVIVEDEDGTEVIQGLLQGTEMDDLREFVKEYDAAVQRAEAGA